MNEMLARCASRDDQNEIEQHPPSHLRGRRAACAAVRGVPRAVCLFLLPLLSSPSLSSSSPLPPSPSSFSFSLFPPPPALLMKWNNRIHPPTKCLPRRQVFTSGIRQGVSQSPGWHNKECGMRQVGRRAGRAGRHGARRRQAGRRGGVGHGWWGCGSCGGGMECTWQARLG